MRISLRAGERIYLNGAVIRVDRKVSLEILNDVSFLLENHVLQADQTTTQLRQLYFVVQTILMDPTESGNAHMLLETMLGRMNGAYDSAAVLDGLARVRDLVGRDRVFDALKTIRSLYVEEEEILKQGSGQSRAA
ncbi:MAG TPA: flagellar biosynthesis repressor FlbT [Burkholderiales bacterium]|nr:flagellar biosynthesis repressor FlbT [Burkholderiales bacterium]